MPEQLLLPQTEYPQLPMPAEQPKRTPMEHAIEVLNRTYEQEYARGQYDEEYDRGSTDLSQGVNWARWAMIEAGVSGVLTEGNYTVDELSKLLGAMHAIDNIAEGPSFVWEYLEDADPAKLRELYERSPIGVVDTILYDAFQSKEKFRWPTYLRALKTVAVATGEPIGQWRRDGQASSEDPSVRIWAMGKDLPKAYLEIESERIEQLATADSAEKMVMYREVEDVYLKEMLGVPSDLRRDFRLSVEPRTMIRKRGRLVPLSRGGGIDEEAWQRAMEGFGEAVGAAGIEAVSSLYKEFGNVNLDRLKPDQVVRMCKLAQGDPALLDELRNGNVRVNMSEVFGDYNGAFNSIGREWELKEGVTLFFEVRQPSDLYRPFIFLRKHGILPVSWVVSTHGNFEGLWFGEEQSSFNIKHRARRPEHSPNTMSISKSAVGRLCASYMQPSRRTGLREIILSSCLQANSGNMLWRITPTAESIAAQADPKDNVVVLAGRGNLITSRRDFNDRPRFYTDDGPVKAIAFRPRDEHHRTLRHRGRKVGKQAVKYASELR